MFGGMVLSGCCKNDCGRMINTNASRGTTTCCAKCNNQNGLHTQNCNKRHNMCNNCNTRYAACSSSGTQFRTCCSQCPNGHTSDCIARNPQAPPPHIVVGAQWGKNSAHVTVNGFPFAQPADIAGRPPHVDFKGRFPSPGTIYQVSTLQQIVRNNGTAYVRYLLNNKGNRIPYPIQGRPDLHITVYFQPNGTLPPSQLQPPP